MHKISVEQNITNLISLKMGLLLFLQEKKKDLIFGVSLIIIIYMLVAYEQPY